MRGKLVAGNWKMNGNLASNEALLRGLVPAISPLSGVRRAVCAPFPYLAQVQQWLHGTGIEWGAQDVCQYGEGAYTGGVSGAMLADFGCRYAIVGHSERRSIFGELDDVVAAKFAAALEAGITPILCLGESLEEREAGETESVVARQLDAVIAKSGTAALARAVIAYEPVWAIGTGKNATPDDASRIHRLIRSELKLMAPEKHSAIPILYGGSVNRGNAPQLLAAADVEGLLVGGASLDPEGWSAIVRA